MYLGARKERGRLKRVAFVTTDERTATESFPATLDISGLARCRALRISGRVPAARVFLC